MSITVLCLFSLQFNQRILFCFFQAKVSVFQLFSFLFFCWFNIKHKFNLGFLENLAWSRVMLSDFIEGQMKSIDIFDWNRRSRSQPLNCETTTAITTITSNTWPICKINKEKRVSKDGSEEKLCPSLTAGDVAAHQNNNNNWNICWLFTATSH